MYLENLKYKKPKISIYRSRSRFFEMTSNEIEDEKVYKYQVTNIDYFNDPKDGKLDYSKIIDFGKCKLSNEDCKKNKESKKCNDCKYIIKWAELVQDLDASEADEKYIRDLLIKFNENKDVLRDDCYVISMAKKESIPMWNYYASGDGLLIEFDLDKFKCLLKNVDFFIGEVLYGKEARIKVTELIKLYMKRKKSNDIEMEKSKLKESIEHVQLLRKRSEWKYEKEVRVIFKDESFKVRNDSRFTRYIEVEMDSISNAINLITVSPMLVDSVYFMKNLKRYISLLQNKKIEIKKSDIKMRDR